MYAHTTHHTHTTCATQNAKANARTQAEPASVHVTRHNNTHTRACHRRHSTRHTLKRPHARKNNNARTRHVRGTLEARPVHAPLNAPPHALQTSPPPAVDLPVERPDPPHTAHPRHKSDSMCAKPCARRATNTNRSGHIRTPSKPDTLPLPLPTTHGKTAP